MSRLVAVLRGDVTKKVAAIADDERTKSFYLGRTDDIRERENRHQADGTAKTLEVLVGPVPAAVAVAIEGKLIKAFISHSKCINDANHGGGGVSPSRSQFVYVGYTPM